jgi:hypothetical protein
VMDENDIKIRNDKQETKKPLAEKSNWGAFLFLLFLSPIIAWIFARVIALISYLLLKKPDLYFDITILLSLVGIVFPFYLIFILYKLLENDKYEFNKWNFLALGIAFSLLYSNMFLPDFLPVVRDYYGATFCQCQSNCKNIGTALEMYSTDNHGHFPSSISMLSPNYLKSIPTCAAGKSDTYSSSYVVSRNPDAYTFFCSGNHHGRLGIPPNYPQYDSRNGLTQR